MGGDAVLHIPSLYTESVRNVTSTVYTTAIQNCVKNNKKKNPDVDKTCIYHQLNAQFLYSIIIYIQWKPLIMITLGPAILITITGR